MDRTARLIGEEARFRAAWEREPLVIRSGNNIEAELSEGALLEAVESGYCPSTLVRLMRDGDELAPEEYTSTVVGQGRSESSRIVDPERTLARYKSGYTIIFSEAQRFSSHMSEMFAELAGSLGYPIDAVAFLTPPRSKGATAHYDTCGNLIKQISGRKTWRLYPPHVKWPVEPWTRESTSGLAEHKPVLEVSLGPGDALYLPRGFVHAGAAEGARASLHLTIGFKCVTWGWLLQKILARAAVTEEALREGLPLGYRNDPRVLSEELLGRIDALHRFTSEWAADKARQSPSR